MKLRVTVAAILLVPGLAFAQAPAARRLAPVEVSGGQNTARVDLGAEFPQLMGYTFTQSVSTVAPGTGKSWHSHAGNPEIVRIISGVLTDSRNGDAPKTYGAGSTLINAGGTQHMWANLGTEPVVLVATAIHAPKLATGR